MCSEVYKTEKMPNYVNFFSLSTFQFIQSLLYVYGYDLLLHQNLIRHQVALSLLNLAQNLFI